MASNQGSRADRSRRRMALAVVIGALLLAAGGWLSSRPSNAAGPAKATAASSPTNKPGSPLPAAKAEGASASAAMAVASSAPGSTSAPPLAPDWPAAALRRVQLALDGHGTPKDMLEAAMMLSACQGADAMVDHQYKERDQPSATSRQLQPSSARPTRLPRG